MLPVVVRSGTVGMSWLPVPARPMLSTVSVLVLARWVAKVSAALRSAPATARRLPARWLTATQLSSGLPWPGDWKPALRPCSSFRLPAARSVTAVSAA